MNRIKQQKGDCGMRSVECGTIPHSVDKLKEECGIFGISSQEIDVGKQIYFGLFALQHRGQESAGIAVSGQAGIACYKDVGLVNQVFVSEEQLSQLKGNIGIGHVRYSTTGSSKPNNAQPFVACKHKGEQLEMDYSETAKSPYYNPASVLALAHNGNLVNAVELRDKLIAKGCKFQSSTDSEVIVHLIAEHMRHLNKGGKKNDAIEKAILACMDEMKGAYALVVMTPNKLIGVRDPYGIRPLSLGKIEGGYVLASETCALDIVGAKFIRDIKPGECCVIQPPHKPVSFEKKSEGYPALCIFELIYFARPDSELSGLLVDEVREQMGRELAREHPLDVDIVIPVPDSGVPAALGYADELDIKYRRGLIKNRYVLRTFILPDQHLRDVGIRMKLNPQRRRIEGKRVAIVDDSIVRGTTSSKIVKMLRDAGAKEVHVLVCCPPIRYPCYYGIDTTGRGDLIAANKDEAEICRYIGADSLRFLSIEGLLRASQNDNLCSYCTACFDGNYPIPLPSGLRVGKLDLEEVLK